MPNSGSLLTIVLIGVVSALLVFITIRMKRTKARTRVPYRPQVPARRQSTNLVSSAPAPQPTAQPSPTPTPVQTPSVTNRNDKALENFRAGLWRMFGAGIAMIIVVLLAKNLNKMKNDYIFDGPTARPQPIAGASPYFAGKYIFENEVKLIMYSDTDLALTPRKAWNMVDTVKHESGGFRMYNQDGSVLRGNKNPRDVGVYQINLDASKKEMAEAGCTEAQMESFDCQNKVFKLIYKKYGPEHWKSYDIVMKVQPSKTTIVAPVGEWSEIYPVRQGSSCLWTVDREVDMLLASGEVKKLIPNKATFFDSPTTAYSVPDGTPGTVTIECRP